MDITDITRMQKERDFMGLQNARNASNDEISKLAAQILCENGFHEWYMASETRSLTGDFFWESIYRCSNCGESFKIGSEVDNDDE